MPLREPASAFETGEPSVARDLLWARALARVPVVLVFPLGSLAVFRLGFVSLAWSD